MLHLVNLRTSIQRTPDVTSYLGAPMGSIQSQDFSPSTAHDMSPNTCLLKNANQFFNSFVVPSQEPLKPVAIANVSLQGQKKC